MNKSNIILLHGFASSSQGTKGTFLAKWFGSRPDINFRAIDFTPTPQDFEYMTITGMINRLRQYVIDHRLEPFLLVGSSMGGLVGVHYAHRFGGVRSSVLLAPALGFSSLVDSQEEAEVWRRAGVIDVFHFAFEKMLPLRYELQIDGRQYTDTPPPTGAVTIVHGSGDEVVPVKGSRQYVAAHPELVTLVEVDAGHDLNPHLDLVAEKIEEQLAAF